MGGRKLKIYLSAEYVAKLETLARLTGKPRSQLIREAIDMLLEKYVGGGGG